MRRISLFLVILTFLFSGTIFAAEGDVLWTRTYDSPGTGEDLAWGIAVDGDGNVYVTGYVEGVDRDIWVGKYTSDGYLVWTSTYNGSFNAQDEGQGIAVDKSGNVYVCGWETGVGSGVNRWLRKYNPGGEVVWTEVSTTAGGDACYGVTVDDAGNIYVTGYESPAGNEDIFVAKIDSDRNLVWADTYSGSGNQDDVGHGITVDDEGNVYVVGYEYVPGEDRNIWVRKYDKDGKVVWTKTHHGGAPGGRDYGYGVAVDKEGNVYVCGSEQVTGEGDNIWVGKYSSDGDVVWTGTYNGPANGYDEGSDITIDGTGNVYVTGARELTGNMETWLRKYTSDGDIVWTKTYGETPAERGGTGVAVDRSGNVYVCGGDYDPEHGCRIWVRKYEGAFGENFQPPEEGKVKVQGGERGYVNPKKGEVAKIHFQPSESGVVKVKIYTLRGQLVWEGSKSVSGYQDYIEWNCKNKDNDIVASGIYVVYVEGAGIKEKKKVAILK